MNPKTSRHSYWLWFGIGVLGLIALAIFGVQPLQRAGDERVRPPQKIALLPASSPALAKPAPPASQPVQAAAEEGAVANLVAQQIAWGKLTNAAEADRLEIWLKDQITDANAGEIVRTLPPELLETQFGFAALERWASIERAATVDWLSWQKKATPFQIGAALRGWIGKDAKGLFEYVDGLEAGAWKEKVLAETAADAVRNQQPVAAVTLVRQMDEGATRARLMSDTMISWGRMDPSSAADWLEQVSDAATQQQLAAMLAIGYASSQPREAAEWLADAMPAGQALDEAMGNVVSVWTSEGRPREAAEWVAQLPDGAMRQAALQKLVERWQEFDREAASRWIAALPAGPFQEQARNALAGGADAAISRR